MNDYFTLPLRLRLRLATHWNASERRTDINRNCIRYYLRLTAQGQRDQYPLP